MSTTIRLDDDLFRAVEAQAAREGRTVGEVVEDALRLDLYGRRQRRRAGASIEPLSVYGGGVVMPGVELGDTAALRDLMEADVSVDAFR